MGKYKYEQGNRHFEIKGKNRGMLFVKQSLVLRENMTILKLGEKAKEGFLHKESRYQHKITPIYTNFPL